MEGKKVMSGMIFVILFVVIFALMWFMVAPIITRMYSVVGLFIAVASDYLLFHFYAVFDFVDRSRRDFVLLLHMFIAVCVGGYGLINLFTDPHKVYYGIMSLLVIEYFESKFKLDSE